VTKVIIISGRSGNQGNIDITPQVKQNSRKGKKTTDETSA